VAVSGLFAIRDAGPADLDAIGAVYRRASLSNAGDREALLAHPDALEFDATPVELGRTRVAVVDEVVVGFASTSGAGDAWELDDLFVDPDRMRQGIATALVHDVEARARAAGVTRVEVTANEHAMAFYRSAGFVDAGTAATRFGPAPRMVLHVGGGPGLNALTGI
jgi:GNAT superfamily N-acetyltransferase